MRIKSGHLALAAVCLFLGFLLSINYRVQRRLTETVSVVRDQEAVARLQDAEKQNVAAQAELQKLRQRLDDMAKAQTGYEALSGQLQDAEVRASLSPMKGPGVLVTMDDSKLPVKPGENPNYFILHDSDVLQVINELTAGGAEALSINGQRYTARTEVRCVGPTITINGVRTAPPVYIQAIGDADVLEAAINLRGGVAAQLSAWGIQVSVKKEKELTVPAFQGTQPFRFAAPVKGGT